MSVTELEEQVETIVEKQDIEITLETSDKTEVDKTVMPGTETHTTLIEQTIEPEKQGIEITLETSEIVEETEAGSIALDEPTQEQLQTLATTEKVIEEEATEVETELQVTVDMEEERKPVKPEEVSYDVGISVETSEQVADKSPEKLDLTFDIQVDTPKETLVMSETVTLDETVAEKSTIVAEDVTVLEEISVYEDDETEQTEGKDVATTKIVTLNETIVEQPITARDNVTVLEELTIDKDSKVPVEDVTTTETVTFSEKVSEKSVTKVMEEFSVDMETSAEDMTISETFTSCETTVDKPITGTEDITVLEEVTVDKDKPMKETPDKLQDGEIEVSKKTSKLISEADDVTVLEEATLEKVKPKKAIHGEDITTELEDAEIEVPGKTVPTIDKLLDLPTEEKDLPVKTGTEVKGTYDIDQTVPSKLDIPLDVVSETTNDDQTTTESVTVSEIEVEKPIIPGSADMTVLEEVQIEKVIPKKHSPVADVDVTLVKPGHEDITSETITLSEDYVVPTDVKEEKEVIKNITEGVDAPTEHAPVLEMTSSEIDESYDIGISVETAEKITDKKSKALYLSFDVEIDSPKKDITTTETVTLTEMDVSITEDADVTVLDELNIEKDIPIIGKPGEELSVKLEQADIEITKKSIPTTDKTLDLPINFEDVPLQTSTPITEVSSDIGISKTPEHEIEESVDTIETLQKSKEEQVEATGEVTDKDISRVGEQKLFDLPTDEVSIAEKREALEKVDDVQVAEIFLPVKTPESGTETTIDLLEAEISIPSKTSKPSQDIDVSSEIIITPKGTTQEAVDVTLDMPSEKEKLDVDKSVPTTKSEQPEEPLLSSEDKPVELPKETTDKQTIKDKDIDLLQEELAIPSKPTDSTVDTPATKSLTADMKPIGEGRRKSQTAKTLEIVEDLEGGLSDHDLEVTVDTEEITNTVNDIPEESAYGFDISVDSTTQQPTVTPKRLDFVFDVAVDTPKESQTKVETITLDDTSSEFDILDKSEKVTVSEESAEYKIALETQDILKEQKESAKPEDKGPAAQFEPTHKPEKQTGEDIEKYIEKYDSDNVTAIQKPEGDDIALDKLIEPALDKAEHETNETMIAQEKPDLEIELEDVDVEFEADLGETPAEVTESSVEEADYTDGKGIIENTDVCLITSATMLF